MKFLLALVALWVCLTNHLFGQSTPIQLDRPDQTESPSITPEYYIQAENGFTFEKTDASNKSFLSPTSLWKYGLNEKFEFRLITEINSVKSNNKTITGLNPITLGFKTNICQEKGIVPTTSFIGHLTTAKIGSKDFHTTYLAPSFRFLMQNSLSEKLALGYNLGVEWDGETAEQTYIYTLTTGISLTDALGCYLEIFGFAPQDSKANHNFDGGLTYLVNNDFMLDLSGGFGLTENALEYYTSVGISFKFNTRRD